jgi:Fur family peroxide stress response transcriptional regulator
MTAQKHYQELVQGLRRAGMKLTPQRIAILQLLAASRTHPTAHAIYQELLPRFSTMSLTTVYNTLQTLVKLGLIHELGQAGDDTTHYDTDPAPHINLVCTSCGKIADYDEESLVPTMQLIATQSGYQIRGARIVYYGLCPACRRKKASS